MEGPAQVLFSNIDYDRFVGRIGIGRVERGEIKPNMQVVVCGRDGETRNGKIGKVYVYQGLKKVEVESAGVGEIVAVSGITDLNIGETVCAQDCVEALPFVQIDEPTVSMMFMVNNSPFSPVVRVSSLLPETFVSVCLRK